MTLYGTTLVPHETCILRGLKEHSIELQFYFVLTIILIRLTRKQFIKEKEENS